MSEEFIVNKKAVTILGAIITGVATLGATGLSVSIGNNTQAEEINQVNKLEKRVDKNEMDIHDIQRDIRILVKSNGIIYEKLRAPNDPSIEEIETQAALTEIGDDS